MEESLLDLKRITQAYMDRILKQKVSVEFDLDLFSKVKKFLENEDFNALFSLSDVKYGLDESLLKNIEALKYFYVNNKTTLSQFSTILEVIKQNGLFKDAESKYLISSKKIKEISELIDSCSDVLNGIFDINTINKILSETSGLTNQEILDILLYIVKMSCPKNDALTEEDSIQKKSSTEIQTSKVSPQLLKIKEKIIQENKALFDQIDSLLTEYYDLYQKYNTSALSIYLNMSVELLQEEVISANNMDYDEVKFVILLKKLIDDKDAFLQLVDSLEYIEDVEIIEEELENIKSDLKTLKDMQDTVLQFCGSNYGEEVQEGQNVVFLLDEDNSLMFDTANVSKGLKSILEKLEKSLFDYRKGQMPNRVHGLNDESLLVRVNYNSTNRMGCTFMELPNNVILVLTICSNYDLIDETKRIANKYGDMIYAIRSEAQNNPQALIDSQKFIADEINKVLTVENERKKS